MSMRYFEVFVKPEVGHPLIIRGSLGIGGAILGGAGKVRYADEGKVNRMVAGGDARPYRRFYALGGTGGP